jgi:BirA family transcriptional regulator, biotin operon repressor / biotin---[acetyl-CoA-carboxylase] ligase
MKESLFVKHTTLFLRSLDFVKNPVVFDELESTNATAKDLAKKGAQEGTVVIARTQKQGRGRFDRRWESPEGGMYLSLVLRPKVSLEKTSLLSFVGALAVAKTINTYGVHATIKWPNDVRINGRKIAGILLESEAKGSTISSVIMGIGVNLAIDLQRLPAELQMTSTSLQNELHEAVDYDTFLQTFFKMFQHSYVIFQEQRFSDVIAEWKTYADTLGKQVRIQTMTETLQGTAVDVDESGFLLLRTTAGVTKKVLSGDCLYFDELHHA